MKISDLLKKQKRHIIAALSCFAFFCSIFALSFPAKTLEPTFTGGQSDSVSTSLPTTVNVSVKFDDVPQNGDITVTLFKDGNSTDKRITLNSANNFSGEFTNLESGNYYIKYTAVSGYGYSLNSKTEENFEFIKANSFTDENTYILVHGNNPQAVQNSSGTSLSYSNVTIQSNKISSEISDAMQWYYNGVSLKNTATSNYLKLNTSGASTDSAVQNRIVYENGHIRRTDTSSRYLLWYNGAYTSTQYSTYATSFSLYEKSNETASVNFEITGTKLKENPNISDAQSFKHNKTIDYLGDGGENPDTALSGNDYYRLYLDMTGKQEPVDLLFVVDGSGSMSKTDVDNMRRDAAITKFLNGSTNSSNDNGFLSYFLNLNPENKVSVIQFYGKTADRNTHNVSNSALDYTYDSSVLMDWTDKNRFVNCANQNNNGTNYEAGLKRATNQFLKVNEDGNKKIMIFLSDGVPTYFQIDSNDVGTVCGGYTLRTSDVGKRWGTGSYTSTSNYPYCKNPSEKAFDDFISSTKDVTVFTIGVSADVSETSQSESQSPEVLKYMAEHGKGTFLSVIDSMDELKLELQSIFYPKSVTITDNLSKYVRYCEEQPDVLVTMTDNSTGDVTVLYRLGNLTPAANGILTDIVYQDGDKKNLPTESTGTISAIFDANYQFKPEYTYTLSFNVKTTHTAYKEFASGGYNAAGDSDTDYGTNKTSSEKDGFYSNDSALVSYNVSNNLIKESYRLPVIQVQNPKGQTSCSLTVSKTVSGAYTTDSFPFELTVSDGEGNAIDLSNKKLPEGVKLKPQEIENNVLIFKLADKESVTLENIIPKGARLNLTEAEHNGYTVSMKTGDFESVSGESQSFDLDNDLEITVINSAGAILPNTGSAGRLLLTLGGLFIIWGACVYRYIQKCSRERRKE